MAAGGAVGRVALRPVGRVRQPIAFNHQKHTADLGIECSVCHELYQTSRHAGLPTLDICLGCHAEAQGDAAEEKKIRDLAAAGSHDVFRKLFRLADHTFYTHQRHVTIAGIECTVCHGPIAQTTRPPESPLVHITMDLCLDCHRSAGVSLDCTRCHR